MSGPSIASGGAITVDPDELRAAAQRADAATDLMTDAADALLHAAGIIDSACIVGIASDGADLAVRARRAIDEGHTLATDLRNAAIIYEITELRLALQQPGADAEAIQKRIRHLFAGFSATSYLGALQSDAIIAQWRGRDSRSLIGQVFRGAGPFGVTAVAGLWALQGIVHATARGRIAAGTTLNGPLPAVTVTQTQPPEPVKAPVSLTDAFSRIPNSADEARIRIEKYEMAGGENTFVVYVTGTREDSPTEAFDGDSNLQLYFGNQAASSAAVTEAMRQAGVQPGDSIINYGYSQGAMITEHLAMDPRYQVEGQYTLGGPVEGEMGPDTLHVAVRHDDDPIVLLADGGLPGQNGRGDSMVIRDTAHPDVTPEDANIPGHSLERYLQTTRWADGSEDPRMNAVREQLAGLADAKRVTAYEFGAERETRP
ncbi:hypothetical protein [Microbacterium sp. ZW T5_56]|uniref:hypothetical protein n=1 Tax=Microbacterium sp. ZW T5_56 TaxID=3378081 RepID=UPI003851F3EE